jgi:hypothetical protein
LTGVSTSSIVRQNPSHVLYQNHYQFDGKINPVPIIRGYKYVQIQISHNRPHNMSLSLHLFRRPNPLRLFHLKGKHEKKESFKSVQSNPVQTAPDRAVRSSPGRLIA